MDLHSRKKKVARYRNQRSSDVTTQTGQNPKETNLRELSRVNKNHHLKKVIVAIIHLKLN